MKLKRIDAGHYQTKDGLFFIIKKPDQGCEARGGWNVYEKGDDYPCFGDMYGTLRDARHELEKHLSSLRESGK